MHNNDMLKMNRISQSLQQQKLTSQKPALTSNRDKWSSSRYEMHTVYLCNSPFNSLDLFLETFTKASLANLSL